MLIPPEKHERAELYGGLWMPILKLISICVPVMYDKILTFEIFKNSVASWHGVMLRITLKIICFLAVILHLKHEGEHAMKTMLAFYYRQP